MDLLDNSSVRRIWSLSSLECLRGGGDPLKLDNMMA